MHHQIDIIVPIYNRAAYIPNLIGQLEKQTFRDFRVIFVDDGSRDDSYETLCRATRISLATLGNDAGAYGAFKLALDAFGA